MFVSIASVSKGNAICSVHPFQALTQAEDSAVSKIHFEGMSLSERYLRRITLDLSTDNLSERLSYTDLEEGDILREIGTCIIEFVPISKARKALTKFMSRSEKDPAILIRTAPSNEGLLFTRQLNGFTVKLWDFAGIHKPAH